MLAKTNRLTTTQFDQFFHTGKRFHTKQYTVIYAPHPTFHGAVVVGKKVDKRAVVRNTLRRRIYSLLYRTLKLSGETGVFIVLTKPAITQLTRKELQTQLTQFVATIPKKA